MPNTRNLILNIVHDDTFDTDGELLDQGYLEERDMGPATPEQVEASDAAGDTGIIALDSIGLHPVPEGGRMHGALVYGYVTA